MQFPHHYGEVRGLSNVLILQQLIKIQKEEKKVLPKNIQTSQLGQRNRENSK